MILIAWVGSSGTRFSLRGLALARTKTRKLKLAPLKAKKMAGGLPIPANHAFHSIREEAPATFPECESGTTWCKTRQAVLRCPQDKKPVLLCRERTAAAATAGGLRVLENEAAPHQVFLIVQRGVIQVKEALRVHEQPRAVFLDHFVAVARLRLQTHRVRQPGAAAALNAHAQPAGFRRHAFLGEQFLNFGCRFFGNVNHISFHSASFLDCALPLRG